MPTRRPATRPELPEDDPALAELVADLKTLHRAYPPPALRQRLVADLGQRSPKGEGAIPFTSHNRPREIRANRKRSWLTQGIAAAIFISALVLASGALTFSVRRATTSRPVMGASSPTGIPRGAQITPTIDRYVQAVVEQDLAQAVKHYGASGGSIVVERPSDGAIIAMSSLPNHDSRTWQQIIDQYNTSKDKNNSRAVANPAISGQYEPGQIFQAFTAAIGMDTNAFSSTTSVFDSGKLKVDGITIQNWCLDQCGFGGYENVSYMLHYSSDIGAAQFSRLIPTTTWYSYLAKFGFDQPSGIDLPGEVAGKYQKPTGNKSGIIWVPAYKDTQAYGQGIAVTPLQVTNAYAALANGGRLMVPHMVQSYTLKGKTMVIQPRQVRQVISGETAGRMNTILVNQAINGEACEALVPGYDVAAKTGTASIPQFGSYAPNQTIADADAFAPAEDPKFVVLVKLDKPNVPWSSETAAPTLHNVLKQLFTYYKIPPTTDPIQPMKVCHVPGSP